VKRLRELELRRHELIERSAAQRAALRASVVPMVERFASVDRAVTSVRRYPMLATGIAAAVTIFGSRKMFNLIARGITLYTLLKKI